ncbi:MAG TPA: hypothetical protein DCE44_09925 [Verrucomicrobiales bacterium]|nr:hypothetical protein [Verrucomicrobiales bacterium]
MDRGHEPGQADVPRRPRAICAVFRNDVTEEFDAPPRKADPGLRPDRARRSAPSRPFEWFIETENLLRRPLNIQRRSL